MNFIGIDIGGTNTRVAVVSSGGVIAHIVKQKTTKSNDFFPNLIRMIESLPGSGECSAIGLGVPGMVEGDRITTCRNLKILVDFPLVQKLQKHFNKPVYMQNDAKVATLGEALAGAGRNSNIVAYVGLGTGLGGGVVINKQLYLGASGLGGYFSRIILDGQSLADDLVSAR